MSHQHCHPGHTHDVKINGIYSKPVDLNKLLKFGRYKIKLGEHRPPMTQVGADALINISKHDNVIIQSVLVLSGHLAGKTYTRSSFDNGKTWTEYISSVDVLDKLDKNFDNFTEKVLEETDYLVVWSGKDNFKISAVDFQKFITGEYNKGYVNTVAELQKLDGKLGDFAIVGQTASVWIWTGDKWENSNTTPVTSVNDYTGDVKLTAKDILGIDTQDFLNRLQELVDSLNNNYFTAHIYTGEAVKGRVQPVPGIKLSDRLMVIYAGVVLNQEVDYEISDKDTLYFRHPYPIVEGTPFHVFKIVDFSLTNFVEENS